MKGASAALALLVLAAALAVIPVSDGSAQTEAYPDADVLIYSEGGETVVEYVEDGVKVFYASGEDAVVASNSEVSGSLSVVMTSGSLGTLTVLTVDGASPAVDLDFTMVSGSLERLVAVSAEEGADIPSSYGGAYSAVGSLVMDIGGSVTEVCTTEDRLKVGSLELTVSESATVDRLYPTGDDGVYGDVTVVLGGGTVGYMSNRASVVSSLTYDLRAGSVRYLCIGADTEGGRSELWTFYVRGDVSVSIGSSCDVGSAVVGGGVLTAPSVLRNGEAPETIFSRTIVIDAQDAEISATSCFLAGTGRAYALTGYTMGSTPLSEALSANYGDGGVWASADGQTVEGGKVLYLNTVFDVVSGSVLAVEAGGRVVNAGLIVLSGSMESRGTVVNNGLIEVLSAGSFEGAASGTGFVAQGLAASVIDSKISVNITDWNAVIIRSSSGEVLFDEMEVRFPGISSIVEVSAPETMYMSGESFFVALSLTEGEGYDVECVLSLSGFATEALTITVTVPAAVPTGYSVSVVDSSGEEAEVVSYTASEVVFEAAGSGTYTVRISSEDGGEDSTLLVNSVIATAIVAVAAVVAYLLLRRDRGRGPS